MARLPVALLFFFLAWRLADSSIYFPISPLLRFEATSYRYDNSGQLKDVTLRCSRLKKATKSVLPKYFTIGILPKYNMGTVSFFYNSLSRDTFPRPWMTNLKDSFTWDCSAPDAVGCKEDELGWYQVKATDLNLKSVPDLTIKGTAPGYITMYCSQLVHYVGSQSRSSQLWSELYFNVTGTNKETPSKEKLRLNVTGTYKELDKMTIRCSVDKDAKEKPLAIYLYDVDTKVVLAGLSSGFELHIKANDVTVKGLLDCAGSKDTQCKDDEKAFIEAEVTNIKVDAKEEQKNIGCHVLSDKNPMRKTKGIAVRVKSST